VQGVAPDPCVAASPAPPEGATVTPGRADRTVPARAGTHRAAPAGMIGRKQDGLVLAGRQPAHLAPEHRMIATAPGPGRP
jgi:hypothetical protein